MTSFSDSADTRLAGVSSSQTDQRSERAEASDGTGAATEAACGTEAPGRIRQRSNILQRLGAEVLIDCTQINSGNITMHLRRGIHDKEHLLEDVGVGISSSQALALRPTIGVDFLCGVFSLALHFLSLQASSTLCGGHHTCNTPP